MSRDSTLDKAKAKVLKIYCTRDLPCSSDNLKCKYPNCTRGEEQRRLDREAKDAKTLKRRQRCAPP